VSRGDEEEHKCYLEEKVRYYHCSKEIKEKA
jgi:hypothetical protein